MRVVTTRTREICSNCGSIFILEDEDGKPYCFICGRSQLTYADYGRIGGLQTVLRHPPGYMRELGARGGRPKTKAAPAPEVKSKLKGGKLPNSIRELRELWRVKVGEIRHGKELGYKSATSFIWQACADCGKERWVRLNRGKSVSRLCRQCHDESMRGQFGELNRSWRGGQRKSVQGYVLLYKPDHPCAPIGSYIRRARLILEEELGRHLLPNMTAHHLNGIKDDDRPENLVEILKSEHTQVHRPIDKRWSKIKRGQVR